MIYFTIFIKIKEELKKILRVVEKEIVKTKQVINQPSAISIIISEDKNVRVNLGEKNEIQFNAT